MTRGRQVLRARIARPTSTDFDRLGLDYLIVSAVSGGDGRLGIRGVPRPYPVGEDTFVRAGRGYAANVEAVTSHAAGRPRRRPGPRCEEVHTPDTPDDRGARRRTWGIDPGQTLKNVLVKIDGVPVAVGVPGDRELDIEKLETALAPSVVEPFEAADFAAHPELVRGYVGPQHGLVTTTPTPESLPERAGSPAPTSPTITSST